MDFILTIIGIVILVISAIAGAISGSLLVFLAAAAGGFASAMIFFALSKIIQNQNTIIYKLDYQYSQDMKARSVEKKICTKCNKTYDPDYTSCPHCGNRD